MIRRRDLVRAGAAAGLLAVLAPPALAATHRSGAGEASADLGLHANMMRGLPPAPRPLAALPGAPRPTVALPNTRYRPGYEPYLGGNGRVALYNVHTLESLTVAYRDGGGYKAEALARIDRFLRDWRTGTVTRIDPKSLDILSALQVFAGSATLCVLSGYRTPETNAMLARTTPGVARNSLHIAGKAIDLFVPGFDLRGLRERALVLRAGGVGYYPDNGFIHVDTGRVRSWEAV